MLKTSHRVACRCGAIAFSHRDGRPPYGIVTTRPLPPGEKQWENARPRTGVAWLGTVQAGKSNRKRGSVLVGRVRTIGL